MKKLIYLFMLVPFVFCIVALASNPVQDLGNESFLGGAVGLHLNKREMLAFSLFVNPQVHSWFPDKAQAAKYSYDCADAFLAETIKRRAGK
jgi:hypothetical protein